MVMRHKFKIIFPAIVIVAIQKHMKLYVLCAHHLASKVTEKTKSYLEIKANEA